ncbi:meiosis-specific nuclear structural protein 1 [Drosophila albomicans]|uniref:Meiosis-specific nuclear structural protein 1 n=1 Tax=Drosophila albomicans TaxID=7291 RepID=A0A6P8WUB3_DROAB|nr:meiosis-specific nuclear structural protein 1 [Drosophila albomicans]
MDSDSSCGAAALADDSGLFSCSSETETEEATNHSNKEQQQDHKDSLFLVTQELRKSRNEVERLNKSEQWYKHELQTQKHNRLATLERLYAQERKYMLENQRLQQESQQLQAKCATLQSSAQTAAAAATQPLPLEADQSSSIADAFEAEQQQARLMDQRQLIEVLRKQKKALLEDIQRLSLDSNDKLLQLQHQLAGVELENKHMTRQCKQLLDEQRELAHKLELKASTLHTVAAERDQLRQVIAELTETLQTQEQLLALKEREFVELKQHYQQKLSSECSIDAMHSYSLAFHSEINARTSEIAALKHALHDLQTELQVMSQLQAQNEQQQRQLEELNFQLEAQQLEQALKDARLEDLSAEKTVLADELQATQQTVHNLEQQLVELHKQYAETCTKCEHTKAQLETQQSQNVQQQQQLLQLREQLAHYVQQCSKLSKAVLQMENKLEQQQQRKAAQDQGTQTPAVVKDNSELEERIAMLEEQLEAVKKQKQQTVALLQQLLQQQDAKIRNTNEMEADWRQLLEALQATQQMEQQVQLQLQQKSEELHQLNELFAQQNEQLQKLQLLSQAHETQSNNELQQLKQAQASDAVALSELRAQVQALLEERENAPRQRHKTLVQVLEVETGRKLQHVKNWPQLTKMLRQELRAAKAVAELPALKMKLVKINGKHEQALARIKFLEETLAAERSRFESSDSGKSTASSAPLEPAHEVANLIDDYKKLIQQTAQETGRPRNSYILELIERSQRCQPNLCQLSEDLDACREDMLDLNKLLASLEPSSTRPTPMPSLMEELRAVAEQT